ncbi:MAG: hypothetical protein ACR2LI_01885 [Propionibacteriaceae bacterium]
MEINTEAIVRLAWSRQLGLHDDALARDREPQHGRTIRVEASDQIMVVRLWDDTVVLGPGWMQDRAGSADPDTLSDAHVLLRLCDGHSVRLIREATLGYTDRYVQIDGLSEVPVADDPESVARLERSCPPDDVAEVGLAAMSRVFVTLDDRDQPTAGAGYDEWAHLLGHVGVLTLPELRRSGWGTRAAALAANDALDAGLVAQWRARVGDVAPRRAARGLGFAEIGSQTSIALSPGAGAA